MKFIQPVLPLFCIVSNHSEKTDYEWSCVAGSIGVCSPVLYVMSVGVFKCKVTNEMGDVCISKEVVSGLLVFVHLWLIVVCCCRYGANHKEL